MRVAHTAAVLLTVLALAGAFHGQGETGAELSAYSSPNDVTLIGDAAPDAAEEPEDDQPPPEPKDSLHEVVPAETMHQGVKQMLVEEEKLYSLMSFNFRKGAPGPYTHVDYYLRHMNRATMISTINGPMDRQDSTWKIVHALCAPGAEGCPAANEGSTGCISLESVNFPGYFLTQREEKKAMRILKADGTVEFNSRASFCIQAGNADQKAISLEFLGEPGKFVRHSGYSLFACTKEDEGDCIMSSRKDEFDADTTFFLKPGLFMGRCGGPEATTKCTCFPGFLGDECTQTCPGRDRTGTVVKVCSGQGDCTLDDKQQPMCHCRKGFLGKECNILCPRDENQNLCSDHGQCAVNDKFEPMCNCDEGFMGDICQYECPGAEAKGACSGHGSCFVAAANPKTKADERAECTCEAGYKGFACEQECPKNSGEICAGHGTCLLKHDEVKCGCFYGWQGEDCSRACPRDAHGTVCGGNGKCLAEGAPGNNSTGAVCECNKGHGGATCQLICPGMAQHGVPCAGNGDCSFNEEAGTASCSCLKTHMGKDCQYRCPMDLQNDLPCGGDHRGVCARDDTALPDQTRCDCKMPYVGKTCDVQCPMFRGEVCGGNGECFIKTEGKVQLGICKCDIGFVGHTCSEKCPHDEDGATCAGHGVCELDENKRSQCVCDDGWMGNACVHRVCNTEGGVFSTTTAQCTCAQSEVCCDKETHRLANMMRQMLAKEKSHTTTQKALKAQSAFLKQTTLSTTNTAVEKVEDLTL
jgi:hypothetical protein